ncbi:PAS-domain containing protein [Rhizobium sp. KVB221]|uniref:histidine kinase n=1 Tax=Rhizobium setariae TaxID=2801340 RepID=A0A937CNV4_9HYPH|nr:PAS domain-containing sensor histidine kinase [Rhizobium setariae]MBL0374181.1 PAS-domain containing protein [Rhizobium setariae]
MKTDEIRSADRHSERGNVEHHTDARRKRLAPVLSRLLFSATALIPVAAQAAEAGAARVLSSANVMSLSAAAGLICVSLVAAFALARKRSAIETENRTIQTALSDARNQISRYEALIADKNRRIVIWDGLSGQPEFLGQLPLETGAPVSDREFLAFGRWLKPRSATELERAIEKLRGNASFFDMVVETHREEVLEAQGRVSGGRAFVRFVALNNLRAELAELQIERDRLQTSIRTFQTLLDAVDMPSWQRAGDGELTWINEAYGEAVGASNPDVALMEKRELLEMVTREKIKAIATPDNPFRDKISTVINGNRTFYDVVDVKTLNGSAGIAIDVSRSEAARDELRRTIKSHAETLDLLATPVAIFDERQKLQYYNQAFRQLWDLDIPFLETLPGHGELLDRLRAASRLPEQLNWKTWKENILSVYRSIEPHTNLWHLPNGQTLRVFATARPQGGATWFFENLTEQVDLETRYNTLLKVQGETIDHLAEGVAVFTPDGKITLSNPAFRALWGVTADEAAPGTHIRAIETACMPSYEQADGWKTFTRIITSFNDERTQTSGKLELKTGLVLDYAVIPLPNAQTMLTFVNVTDSARAERALKDKNDALHKADELKNDFVQHVSYELRSPLTNIIGFTDLLRTPGMDRLTDRQAEYLDHISNSSSLLLTLVNDILDLATVDAGIMELQYAAVPINDLLDEVALQIAHRLQENHVTLKIIADHDLGSVQADHQRLKQIFIKLLTNAANFAPEGSAIGLKCWREDAEFVFTVSDEGPGMTLETLDKIFDRFESDGKGGRKSGPGLGLAIVKSFVNLHRGTISVDTAPGLGTRITCRIPCADAAISDLSERSAG